MKQASTEVRSYIDWVIYEMEDFGRHTYEDLIEYIQFKSDRNRVEAIAFEEENEIYDQAKDEHVESLLGKGEE